MNYPQQIPYPDSAQYNTNNVSPITTSSTTTSNSFYNNNMMDNVGYYNTQPNGRVTPCFNEKPPECNMRNTPNYTLVPNHNSMDYHNNCSYFPPNHNHCSNYCRSVPSTPYTTSISSNVSDDIYTPNDWLYSTPVHHNVNTDRNNTLLDCNTESASASINSINNSPYTDANCPQQHKYYPYNNYDTAMQQQQQQQQQQHHHNMCTYTDYTPNHNATQNNMHYPQNQTNNTNNSIYNGYNHPIEAIANTTSTSAASDDELLSIMNPSLNYNYAGCNDSNTSYPSYTQKCTTYNPRSIDIKQELYRHRKHMLYPLNTSPTTSIKIKGSNFEALLHRLTRDGDTTRCIECNKSFLQKCHLFRHIRDSHLIKPAVHECPFCSKTFHQKSNLDTHCMTHAKHRKFSHPFKCIICIGEGKDKSFTRKSSLKRHCVAKHTNVNVEAEWINKQQTPKWNHTLKTFVFNPSKNGNKETIEKT